MEGTVVVIQHGKQETVLNHTLENEDTNIYIDEDSIKNCQDSLGKGKKFGDHVADAEKSLVTAVSSLSQCQISLAAIRRDNDNPFSAKILSIISNLKSAEQTLDKIHGDLLDIQPLKYEDDLLRDLVKVEVSNQLPHDDTHDYNEESIIGSEANIEYCEVIHDNNRDLNIKSEAKIENCQVEDFSSCDISTEYFCILCEKYFETQGDLDVHKRLCVSKESNKCDVCQKNFRTAKILKEHRAVNHQTQKDETNSKTKKSPKKGNGARKRKGAKIFCENCQEQVYLMHYQRHITRKHSGLHVCNICDEKFDLKEDLKKHMTSIHDPGKKVLECALCQIEFNSIEDYNVHIKTMKHGKMKISCDYCQKLMSVHYYRQHVLTNHSGLHVCNTCDEKFDNKRDLTKHMTSKHCEDAHRCPSCVQIFSNKDQLKSHMEKDHPSKTKCQDCNKDFYNTKGLRTHMIMIHSKMFSCQHCDQEFDTKKKLYTHNTTVHNSKAKKVCQICGYIVESNHPSALWNHQQSHNEDIYKCEVCDKGFKRKLSYKLHARIHTGEKPYECKECGAKFRKQNMLARHRFVHSGEKPHICNLCGRGFNQRNNLKTHMKSHIRGTIPTPASE